MLGHIKVSDINEALPHALPLLRQYGVEHTAASLSNPRATIEWPGLFVTEYWKPQRNVLFDPCDTPILSSTISKVCGF